MDSYSKYLAIAGALRNAPCDLELVTTLTLASGATQEISHSRRAVCKKASRRRNITVLEFADVDRAALDRPFPFDQFTVADFPGLFVDHVGRRIPQGVGTVVKMPLSWVQTAGGYWIYAGPKSTGANTILAVYRGTQPGQGTVVPPAEYTASVAVGAGSGVVVDTVNFVREQIDFNGRPYVIEADYLLSGTRTAPAEIARILALYGIAVDATFATADAADAAAGFFIDALYGGEPNGRTGKAIIEDLLRVARGYISQTASGAWAIVQDVAKASSAEFDSAADEIDVAGYGDGEIRARVVVGYRPRAGNGEDMTATITRAASGAAGDMVMRTPYVRDHGVADRLACYWQRRLNSLRMASAAIHAVQFANGARITITDRVAWNGAKDFLVTGITRPGDKNEVVLREYDASIYTYVADLGALPADATNVYTPDFSFTAPVAPTGVAVASQGVSADTDGKVTAYVTVAAVPPTLNWARLMGQVRDSTTGEIYQLQFRLNGAAWEATFAGLRPNRAHTVTAWAVNSTNVEGATSSPVGFTSANASTALAAPSIAVSQTNSFEIHVDLGAVADVAGQPKFRRYVLFEKTTGTGVYNEVARTLTRRVNRTVSHGSSYWYYARSEDVNGNESADSSIVNINPVAVVGDPHIAPQGVGGPSIANGSINQGRGYTATSSAALALAAYPTSGHRATLLMDVYTFFPSFDSGGTFPNPSPTLEIRGAKPGGNPADLGYIGIINNDTGTGVTININWRKFSP